MKLFLFFLLSFNALSLELPKLTSPVVDEVGLLGPKEQRVLASELSKIYNNSGPQLQLLIVDSLEGLPIEDYSIKIVDEWKLGSKDKDDGLLFLISKNDRKMRIEVGRGLEGNITDLQAGRLIDLARTYFRAGKYSSGIFEVFSQIIELSGYDNSVIKKRSKQKVPIRLIIFIIFFLFVFLSRFFRSNQYLGNGYSSHPRSRYGRGRRDDDFWGGGGFGGGGFGGGGWSGGGGGFSGGGSSGGW